MEDYLDSDIVAILPTMSREEIEVGKKGATGIPALDISPGAFTEIPDPGPNTLALDP